MYESNRELSKMAAQASRRAIKEAKGHKISITYLSGTNIIRESFDGKKEIIKEIPKRDRISVSRRRIKLV